MPGKTRKLSAWNLFTMKLHKQHPEKSFSQVLKLASKLKKQGVDYVSETTKKATKKLRKTVKKISGKKNKRKNKSNKKN
tara:strand:- start:103 stop:339 length:237 start_codon:yes stop_codon:yes gene_type:complete